MSGQWGSDRYVVCRVDNRQWGGIQWAIWDSELETWADDFGRHMSEDAARGALSGPDLDPLGYDVGAAQNFLDDERRGR